MEPEVQHSLPWDVVASVNYVGNHGTNLIIQNNGLNGFQPLFVGLPSTKPDLRFQTITQYQTGAISHYSGLILSARKRMKAGLQSGPPTPSAMRSTKYRMRASSIRFEYGSEYPESAKPE